MQRLKMTLGMLLIAYLSLGISSCQTKQNIDVGIFSRDYQKFYFSNAYTGKKAEFGTQDDRADRLVCVPYQQYIDIKKNYTCTRNTK